MSSLHGTSTVRISRVFLVVQLMRFPWSSFILLDNGQHERSRSGTSPWCVAVVDLLLRCRFGLLLGHNKLLLPGWYLFLLLPISNSPVFDLRSTLRRELGRVKMRFLTISTALLFLLKRAQLSIQDFVTM